MWRSLTAASLVFALSRHASATGETPPIAIVSSSNYNEVAVILQRDDILAISIRSAISFNGRDVAPAALTVLAQTGLLPSNLQGDRSDNVIGVQGDTVTFDVAQSLTLSPGYYAQYILTTIVAAHLDVPVEVAGFNYFIVDEHGASTATSEEYSSATELIDMLPKGQRMLRTAAVRGLLSPTTTSMRPHHDPLVLAKQPGTTETHEP